MCSNYLDAGTSLALWLPAVSHPPVEALYEDQHSCMVVGCRSGAHGTPASRARRLGRSHGSRRPSDRARGGERWIFQLPPSRTPRGGRALRSASGAGRAVSSPARKALETPRVSRGGRLLHRRPLLRPSGLGPPAGERSHRLRVQWPVLFRPSRPGPPR